jgi:hypothetical protein
VFVSRSRFAEISAIAPPAKPTTTNHPPSQAPEAVECDLAVDWIDHDIDGPAARRFVNVFDETAGAVANGNIGPQFAAEPDFVRTTGRHDDGRAPVLG